MAYQIAAELVLVLHLAFVVFCVVGGFVVLRWPRWAWLHLPCVVWAAVMNAAGWVCPLTPLEKWFLRRAGGTGYEGGFLDHYLVPMIYSQEALGQTGLSVAIGVALWNAGVYGWLLYRWRRGRSARA